MLRISLFDLIHQENLSYDTIHKGVLQHPQIDWLTLMGGSREYGSEIMINAFVTINVKIFMIVLSIVFLSTLTACSGGGILEVEEEKEVTLKILVGSPEFYSENATNLDNKYGDTFRKQHPNIKFEYIIADVIVGFPTDYERSTLSEEIIKHKPDLIITNPSYYKETAQTGLLQEIPGSDAANLHTPVIDYIRTLGGSTVSLYGVTDEFFLAAIEYNKKLFDRYQVEYPTDGMTWEELFQLAGKFPRIGDDNSRLYGLYFPWWIEFWQGGLIDAMKRSAGLSYVEEGKFNLHTYEWRQLLSLAVNSYIQGYLSPTKDMDPIAFYEDLFQKGQAAMTYRSFYRSNKGQFMVGSDGFGLVREPIGSTNSASTFRINSIFSVNKQAAHPKEAMDFIRFINSDELVRSNLHQMYGFPARTELIPESRMEALTSVLQFDVNAEDLISRDEIFTVSPGLPMIISFELDKAFKQLVTQKITLDEAITQIEKGAQSKLDEYLSTGKLKGWK